MYRIKITASNTYGESDYSNELIAGLGNKAIAPSAPVRDPSLVLANSMLIGWGQVTTSDLPIVGYILYVDDGLNGDF